MKLVKLLVALAVALAIGAGGGFVAGYMTGKDVAETAAILRTAPPTLQVTQKPAAPAETPKPAAAPEAAPAAAPAAAAAATPAPAAAPAAADEVYTLNSDDSTLKWIGFKNIAGEKLSMFGFFPVFSGEAKVPGGDPAKATFEMTVKMAKLKSNNAILDGVLKGADFFDVEKFPEARLVCTKVEPAADGSYIATVDWTMRDKTNTLAIPLTVEKNDKGGVAKSTITIDRNLWGVGYAEYMGAVILPEVVIELEIVAEKK